MRKPHRIAVDVTTKLKLDKNEFNLTNQNDFKLRSLNVENNLILRIFSFNLCTFLQKISYIFEFIQMSFNFEI